MVLAGAFGVPQTPWGGSTLPGNQKLFQVAQGQMTPPTPTNVPWNQPNPNPQPGDLPWIDHTGQPPAPPVWTGGITGKGQDPRTIPMPPMGGSPGLGGTTRRGSQILDAQGNVIGHYDDNNQPVYHGGQGPQMPMPAPWQLPPWVNDMPAWAQAPRQSQLGVPGSMQQSQYQQGLLRPAMPSMNNQSGY